jgi:hypothetical protein
MSSGPSVGLAAPVSCAERAVELRRKRNGEVSRERVEAAGAKAPGGRKVASETSSLALLPKRTLLSPSTGP